MGDVLLSEREQAALRFVLAAEPSPGQALPDVATLERLATLVRCDVVGATIADSEGYVVGEVALPRNDGDALDEHACDGPLRIGLVHWSRVPDHAEWLRSLGYSDSLVVGFRHRKDGVVQVWWDRRSGSFSERDRAILTMIAPAVHRLVRDDTTPSLPASLTVQERRTLMLVAAGFSNGEIAAKLGVATSTVRKHLEHSYRKLGVSNRLAAAVALRGELVAPPELLEKVSGDD
ncbi:MAG TPA: helix-turn-helix transcriptional regulator [Nocardioides sp.]|uniref:helix-turn-helix transcriptional regulator n=1 Tax=Nocardioides sp. TaxID=35761 RepID=UPI002E342DB4|nr:helix-turn-helix transcriptional regulator [Nocardioides sp.]HEX5090972.1 helix-turn-helix transcriptional regulator [Nocardioides sp.]